MTKERQRTLSQNKAIHLMFEHIAQELNDAGLELSESLPRDMYIPWSRVTVKEILWKTAMKKQFMKKSTTEMTTSEVNLIFETVARFLAGELGIEIEFPSIENLRMKHLLKTQERKV